MLDPQRFQEWQETLTRKDQEWYDEQRRLAQKARTEEANDREKEAKSRRREVTFLFWGVVGIIAVGLATAIITLVVGALAAGR